MFNYVQNNIRIYISLRYRHIEHHNKSIRRQVAVYSKPLSGLISSRTINKTKKILIIVVEEIRCVDGLE
jgi:hypothetical protein